MSKNFGRFNQMYNKLKVREAWRFGDDLTTYTQWGLDTTNLGQQQVPLIFNQTQQNFNLDLQAVPGNVGAYAFLRYLDVTVQKDPNYRSPDPFIQYSNTNVTIPASTNGNVQTFTFNQFDSVRKILFNSIPAGITITDIQVSPGYISDFVDLFPAPITAAGTTIDLESYFGTGVGLPINKYNSTPAVQIKFTTNNTNGSPTAFNFSMYGYDKNWQNSQWLINYADPHGQLQAIGCFDDSLINKTFPLDRLVPVPITDPTSPNFGSLLFTLRQTRNAYYGTETYNLVMGISIAYLLPES